MVDYKTVSYVSQMFVSTLITWRFFVNNFKNKFGCLIFECELSLHCYKTMAKLHVHPPFLYNCNTENSLCVGICVPRICRCLKITYNHLLNYNWIFFYTCNITVN